MISLSAIESRHEAPAVGEGAPPAQSPGPRGNGLPESLKAAKQLLRCGEIADMEERLIALFLGTKKSSCIARPYDHLMGRMLMECFPAFVREAGGTVVHSLRVNRSDRVTEPRYVDMAVGCSDDEDDGEQRPQILVQRPVLIDGIVFIEFGGERYAVHVVPSSTLEIRISGRRQVLDLRERWTQYCRQHSYLRDKVFLPNGQLIHWNPVPSWDDVSTSAQTRAMVVRHSLEFIEHHRKLLAVGVKGRRGLLLEGPPGTGKTLLAKVIAAEAGITVVWVTPRFAQESSQIAAIMEIARFLSPTLLVLEDLDLFGEERENVVGSPLGELMNQLDGALENEAIVTLATTNRLHLVEKALQSRPGRFDRVIHIGPLDVASRQTLLKKLLRRCRISDRDREHLVQVTDDFTGAQLEELVNTIVMEAVVAPGGAAEAAQGDESSQPVVNRVMIELALGEMTSHERRRRAGFATE